MAASSKEMELAIRIAGKVDKSFHAALAAASGSLKIVNASLSVAGGGMASFAGSAASAMASASQAAAGFAIDVARVATNFARSFAESSIQVGKDYEQAMSQVAATMLIDESTEAGAQALQTLENAARECGRNTAFSATEAAEALNYLALAGYNADQAAEALPVVLNLAGAGAMDLAHASDLLTDAMGALQIEATQENLTKFADQMALTASRSNTNVEMLGEAILTVGGTAAGLAGGTAELMTMAGILADVGIKGAEGGTHIRNMLLSLQEARNDDAAAMFEEMGLAAYDAEGNLRSMGEVFGDMNTYMSESGATAEDVNHILSTIFKQTDLAAARAMLAATADSVESLGAVVDASLSDAGTSMADLGINLEEMAASFDASMSQEQFAAQAMQQYGVDAETAGVIFNGLSSIVAGTGNRFGELQTAIENSADACEDMYKIQLNNLKGDIDILNSGIDDLRISVYKDLVPALRAGTQFATQMIGQVSQAYQEGGLGGALGSLGEIAAGAAETIAGQAPAVVDAAAGFIENFLTGIQENSVRLGGAGASMVISLIGGIARVTPMYLLTLGGLANSFASAIADRVPELVDSGANAVLNLISGIREGLPQVRQTARTLIGNILSRINMRAPEMITAAAGLVSEFITGLAEDNGGILSAGADLVLTVAMGISANLSTLAGSAVTLVTRLATNISNNLPKIKLAALALVRGARIAIVNYLPRLISSGTQLVTNLITGIADMLPSLTDEALSLVTGVIDSIGQNLPLLIISGKLIISRVLNGIGESIRLVFDKGPEIVRNLISGLAEAIPTLLTEGGNLVNEIVTGIGESLPFILAQGGAMVTELAQGITDNLPTMIQGAADIILNLLNGIITYLPSVVATGGAVIANIIDGIGASLPTVISSGMTILINLISGIVQLLPSLLDTGFSIILNIIGGITENLPNILAAGATILMNIINGIRDNLPNLATAGLNIVISIGNGIVQMIPALLGMIPSLFGGLVGAVMSIDWTQLGKDLLFGIGDGIMAAFGWLVDTFKGLWDDFVGWIADAGGASDDSWLDDIGKTREEAEAGTAAINSGADSGERYEAWRNTSSSTSETASDTSSARQAGADAAQAYADGIRGEAGSVSQATQEAMDAANSFNYADWANAGNEAAQAQEAGYREYTFTADGSNVDTSLLTDIYANAGRNGGEAYGTGLDEVLQATQVAAENAEPIMGPLTDAMGETGAEAGQRIINDMQEQINNTATSVQMPEPDSSGVTETYNNCAQTAGNQFVQTTQSTISNGSGAITGAAALVASGINSAFVTGWATVRANTISAMNGLISIVTNGATAAANAVKNAFESMTITIPKPSIPVINVSTKTTAYGDGGSVTTPEFSVSWNALGGIFDAPTIFNTSRGMQGVGEAGPEAILPLDTLWQQMRDILTDILRNQGGASPVEKLLERLQGAGGGSGQTAGTMQLAGAGGMTVTFAPTYNLYGAATKEDAEEAGRATFAEFERFMRKWERDKNRTKF